ncbi:ROK family transcriptional regulator [Piscinibacter terrae]|uniref:ROK family transcriptional regulator n=1 Tax=Piscinibacter terrae TaxID=2496871 RepID=A0A3N7JPN0_9BURK|nr:ROK family transcriptional regulator [Albitalea terrae]RQP23009.1 ROK family transcriptional regulator [Albitalea terrae]
MKPSPARENAAPSGTNLEHAKFHNRRVVIEAVRLHGVLTRAEIARLTALTPQTVSNITAELQESGMFTAHSPRKAGRGQPAIPLSINPAGAYSLGVQVDHQSLIALVVDLSGKACGRVETALRRPSPDVVLPLLADVIHSLRRQVDIDWDRMLGAGLVMPGPFGVEGISSKGPTTLHGWEDIDVAADLSERIGLPVLIENDANAAAIGERLYGVAKTLRNYAYLFVGTGLGAGLFLDGQLYKGQARNAGEVGHMIVERDGRPCYCGNRGCLERYVSLLAAYETLGVPEDERRSPNVLLRPGVDLDRWFESAVPALRQAINIVESMLDVASVVIGGPLPAPVLERLVAALEPLPVSTRSRRHSSPRVMIGSAGADTAVLGAAALPVFDEFNPQYDGLMK